ncbi:hypothetical protein ACQ86N_33080 [Puia sp. P3]|uniref:hypothetical protein n=1 Tax=Puia sp. P3 TaxID=3423952 RepID=UPI003D67844B
MNPWICRRGLRSPVVEVPADARFTLVEMRMGRNRVVGLEGNVKLLPDGGSALYREVSKAPAQAVKVRLVPYYAWDNRGQGG